MLEDAATMLGIACKTVKGYVRKGLIVPVRYTRTSKLRFRRVELERFIQNSQQIKIGGSR